MKIASLPGSLASTPGAAANLAKKPKKDWWRELTSGELLAASLHLSPHQLREAITTTSDVGKSLGNAWKDIKEQINKVIHLPALDDIIARETRQRISEIAMTVASTVGYAAAGVQAVAGFVKLTNGIEEKKPLKRLEGCLDIATAGAIASTIGGWGAIPLVMGPLAAALGVARGTAHAVAGLHSGDTRRETQGWLDGTRSAAVLGTLLGRYSALAATAGAILGPVAGAIQVTRGFIDVRDGLAEKSNVKEIQGLTDIGAAVGLTMAATGIGVIPGIVLTALSIGTRVLYQLSDKFEGKVNRTLDQLEPRLEKAVHAVEKVAYPVVDAVRPIFKKVVDWFHGDAPPPAQPPQQVSAGG